MKRTRHNPERRAWKGRSYKAAGRRISDLKQEAASKEEEEEAPESVLSHVSLEIIRQRLANNRALPFDNRDLRNAIVQVHGILGPKMVLVKILYPASEGLCMWFDSGNQRHEARYALDMLRCVPPEGSSV